MIIILMLKYKVKKASYAIFVDAVCRYMYVHMFIMNNLKKIMRCWIYGNKKSIFVLQFSASGLPFGHPSL